MRDIRIAAAQFEARDRDKEYNFGRIEALGRRAVADGAEIVSFHECCISGYTFLQELPQAEIETLAEPVPGGPSTRRLADLARELGVGLLAGLVESDGGKLFNTYVAVAPQGFVAKFRKLHAFVSPHLSWGREFCIFDLCGVRCGILICYDNNLVENVRITALKGADLLLAPHQTGGCNLRNPHSMGLVDRALWDARKENPEAIETELKGPKGRGWLLRWLPSRAHDNGLFLAFANGVGVDDDEIRTGNAMIIDTYGRILAETWKADDDMVVADLDPALFENCTERRWLRSRRPELYAPLTQTTGIEEDTRTVRFDIPEG